MTAICILCPEGRIDGASGPTLDGEIAKSIASGADRLLLDMTAVEYISSAGLRVVLHAARQIKSLGGRLVLCSLNDQTKDVFEISGFSRFLDIFHSRDEAVSRLSA
jgi:anti-anti-sigma factor